MSSGVEEIVPMAGYGQKEDELDGSINCKPLIDGLLMKKCCFSETKTGGSFCWTRKRTCAQDCLPSIAVQDGTSFW